ncbi:MAG: dethiobiotin synthase [Candidatus Omnitrophica bacterium]|nr:dethiobiotin synthase [Candidatus Omnitrophota bacterium]
MLKNKVIFITATDTGAGKTATSYVLGVLLRRRGYDVGIMKPVQCAGRDAQFLKKALGLDDDLKTINPFCAPEPLSPHLAFRRAKITFDKRRLKDCLKMLCARHEVVLVEGAGGLMVPITDSYYTADLIADLKAEVVIVSRLGLGTINHTLLTIREIKRRAIKISGIIFCQTRPAPKGVPESTNPREIERLSGVRVLGTIPYLKPLDRANILRRCRDIKLNI